MCIGRDCDEHESERDEEGEKEEWGALHESKGERRREKAKEGGLEGGREMSV
jgi:hypothetical protein